MRTTSARSDMPVLSVGCEIELEALEPADLVFEVAAARSGLPVVAERISFEGEGSPEVTELAGAHGSRLHTLHALPGPFVLRYDAELAGPHASAASLGEALEAQVDARRPSFGIEAPEYLRPSRYCPSDRFEAFARTEFGVRAAPEAIASWIHERITYAGGSSDGYDGAEHTLLTGQGVCRDFAHLGVTLCRALAIPARYVSVYAPGLEPMDFHAVFESFEAGRWFAHDPTRLVSRASLVRIATGRDAADAAFLSATAGSVNLGRITVQAAGTLGSDDHSKPVELA